MQPEFSPWGEIQWSDSLIPGMDLVSTASHGGVRVAFDAALLLSPAARKCGFQESGYLWFEEDCQEQVVLRELLDKKLWTIPERITDVATFTASIDRSIQTYNPDYWKARERAKVPRAAEHRRSNPVR